MDLQSVKSARFGGASEGVPSPTFAQSQKGMGTSGKKEEKKEGGSSPDKSKRSSRSHSKKRDEFTIDTQREFAIDTERQPPNKPSKQPKDMIKEKDKTRSKSKDKEKRQSSKDVDKGKQKQSNDDTPSKAKVDPLNSKTKQDSTGSEKQRASRNDGLARKESAGSDKQRASRNDGLTRKESAGSDKQKGPRNESSGSEKQRSSKDSQDKQKQVKSTGKEGAKKDNLPALPIIENQSEKNKKNESNKKQDSNKKASNDDAQKTKADSGKKKKEDNQNKGEIELVKAIIDVPALQLKDKNGYPSLKTEEGIGNGLVDIKDVKIDAGSLKTLKDGSQKNSKKDEKVKKDDVKSNQSKQSKQVKTQSGTKKDYDMLNSQDITIEEPSTIEKTPYGSQDPENVPDFDDDDDDPNKERKMLESDKLETEHNQKKQPDIQEPVYLKYFKIMQWYYRNTRSILVETEISLEKHDPENADEFWKTNLKEIVTIFISVGLIMYVVSKNAGNIGNLKQQQVDLVTKSVISYPLSSHLLPIQLFQSTRKYQMTNRMECLVNKDIDSCIDFCGLLVDTIKYNGVVDNLWDCVDKYAKIPPKIYGQKKCNSLDRNGKVRIKKDCYQKINIEEANDFENIYDAKHAFCKWQIKNVAFEVWENCNDKWKVRYDEQDCSYRAQNEKNQTLMDLKKCWVDRAMLPLIKARCNNLENIMLIKFDFENEYPGVSKATNYTLTDEQSLDLRYNCFKYMMNIGRDREFCQNKTQTDDSYYKCLIKNNITVIADDVLFKYGSESYRGVGYDAKQTAEMDKTGIPKDASRFVYELTSLQRLNFYTYESNQMIVNKRNNKQLNILKSISDMLVPYVYFMCQYKQNPFFAFEYIIYYMQIPGAKMMTKDCAWKYQLKKQEYDKYPQYVQDPHEYMKEYYSDQCQRISVDEDVLYQCMSRNRFASNIGLINVPKNSTEAVKAYRTYCNEVFDPKTQATDWFICMVLTGNEKYNQGQCVYQQFVQLPEGDQIASFIFPLTHKYKCAEINLGIIDDQVKECNKWNQKYNVREKCLSDYEANNYMGFKSNYESSLVEYYYGAVNKRIIEKKPFISQSNITITQIQDWICYKQVTVTFNSYASKMENATGEYPANHTIYDLDCNAFLLKKKDRYDRVYIHHYFTNKTMRPARIINLIPPDLDLNLQDGIMPLVFNRTESNRQFLNVTLYPAIDNIPILKTRLFTKPVKEKAVGKKAIMEEAKLKAEGKEVEPAGKGVFIENSYQYDKFTKHPDTIKIFTSTSLRIGESTFSDIFVNCSPEKTKYKGQKPTLVILGFEVQSGDLVVSRILLEKILKPIQSTTDEGAGNKNEIIIDFRMKFTETQAQMKYYSLGDIFTELGGLSASVKLVLGATATLFVLRFVFYLAYMIQRKSSHKFRLLTIDKYKKCLPQIIQIISEIKDDHPDYKMYMEDKESIDVINREKLNNYKSSAKAYDLLRYLINRYSEIHFIKIPQDQERNMLIKLWEFRRGISTKAIIGEVRQRVSMYGIFMSRWKLKEVMIKMENNKLRQEKELKQTQDQLDEALVKIEDSDTKLKKAYKIIEDYNERLTKLEKKFEEKDTQKIQLNQVEKKQ